MATVRDNPDRLRYEVFDDDGALAGFAQYVLRSDRMIFVHTEIDDAFEGKGLGSKLAAGALDDVRRRGHLVVPLCPFIASYIERHPEYDDLVDHAALAALS
ncbi:MAG: molybdenum cofactor cytidylyltransferase [Actinomycetota bacterium]|nr:molybdenum cofactor cytidylyltransferase [Actinomycetota bacterium]